MRSRDHRAERALGAELDEVRWFGLHRFGGGVGELNGRANMSGPVVRVHPFVIAEQPAMQRGEDREGGQLVGAFRGNRRELGRHRVHELRVKRVRHVELTHGDPRLFQGARGLFDRFRCTGQHDLRRAVHRGEVEGEPGDFA